MSEERSTESLPFFFGACGTTTGGGTAGVDGPSPVAGLHPRVVVLEGGRAFVSLPPLEAALEEAARAEFSALSCEGLGREGVRCRVSARGGEEAGALAPRQRGDLFWWEAIVLASGAENAHNAHL